MEIIILKVNFHFSLNLTATGLLRVGNLKKNTNFGANELVVLPVLG